MKAIIIYKGKYGATEQYAEWLGEELQLPVVYSEQISGDHLARYDVFLVGSSVYIGNLQIEKWLKANLEFLKDKTIFFFQVGGTPPEETEKRQEYDKNCIPEEILSNCRFYYLQGRLVKNKLSWKDRFMLKMGAWLTKDLALKKTMITDYDDVKKENIKGLMAAVKSYMVLHPSELLLAAAE